MNLDIKSDSYTMLALVILVPSGLIGTAYLADMYDKQRASAQNNALVDCLIDEFRHFNHTQYEASTEALYTAHHTKNALNPFDTIGLEEPPHYLLPPDYSNPEEAPDPHTRLAVIYHTTYTLYADINKASLEVGIEVCHALYGDALPSTEYVPPRPLFGEGVDDKYDELWPDKPVSESKPNGLLWP